MGRSLGLACARVSCRRLRHRGHRRTAGTAKDVRTLRSQPPGRSNRETSLLHVIFTILLVAVLVVLYEFAILAAVSCRFGGEMGTPMPKKPPSSPDTCSADQSDVEGTRRHEGPEVSLSWNLDRWAGVEWWRATEPHRGLAPPMRPCPCLPLRKWQAGLSATAIAHMNVMRP
jgi:hypothetical protein